ncbi:MAG TPA: hypothetical protein VGK20_13245 [Candidatus Binatia bacterium]|jgi:hypothetical protein
MNGTGRFHRSSLIPALALLVVAGVSYAGVIDSPLPTLGGKGSVMNYAVSGVVNAGGLATIFSCTNTSSSDVTISVELFVDAGGNPCNDANAAAVTAPAGGTVMFSTQDNIQSSFFSTHPLSTPPMFLSVGSARVVSTGKALICSAFIADVYNSPPQSMTPLVLTAKGKQRGG